MGAVAQGNGRDARAKDYWVVQVGWATAGMQSHRKTVGCKLVYKVKRDANGNIEHYKACLVATGYSQRHGIDYDKVYASVGKHTTLRGVLAANVTLDYGMRQYSVPSAFLKGKAQGGGVSAPAARC